MRGSFTVELSIIFPLIFLILTVLMQCGLFYSFIIYSQSLAKQGLLLCAEERNQGINAEDALLQAEDFVKTRLEALPVIIKEIKSSKDVGWLSEGYVIEIVAEYRLFVAFSWEIKQEFIWTNPILFKNRVDFLWEKAHQYLL